LSDNPDVQCRNETGDELNLEITLTEDAPMDIQAALGRSNHLDIGNFDPNTFVATCSADAVKMLLIRLEKKLQKRYGANTALVIRSASGVDWDWDVHIDDIRHNIETHENPFDRGIWLLNRQMDQLFCISTAQGAV